MKKILSVFVTLALALSLLVLPTNADTAEIPSGAATVTIDSVVYTVVREAAELTAMSGENNYILANDIDMNKANIGTPQTWSGILDGNGYSVTNFSVTNGGMFNCTDGTATIKNITFGTAAAPISVIGAGGGLLFATLRNSTLTVENMTAHVDVSWAHIMGGLLGDPASSTLTFRNCKVLGEMRVGAKSGGYIGLPESCTITFENCLSDVLVVGNNQNCGGFIGLINDTASVVTATNCINAGNVSAAQWGCGGLIGKTKGKTTVNGFLNLGVLSHGGTNEHRGALIGQNSGTLVSAEKIFSFSESGSYQYNTSAGNPTPVTAAQLASGEVAYLLGDAFGQRIGVDKAPVLGGMRVERYEEGGNVYYENVYEPIRTVDDLKAINGSGLYRLANDLVLTEAVEIKGGKDEIGTVLDLGDKTLTGNLTVADGAVVIKNGNLVSANDVAALTVKGNTTLETMQINVSGKLGMEIIGSAAVTLGDGTVVNASDVAVFGNGASDDAVLNVDGAELKVTGDAATDSALKWNTLGTLNVRDGTVHADGNGTALEFIKGNAVISGGALSGKYALALAGEKDSTLTIDAGTLQGSGAAVLDKGNSATVLVNGGTFQGTSDGAFAADGAFSTTVSVVGGTFDEEIPTAYLHEYVSVKNEDGSYSVKYHDHDYTDCEYESINVGSHNKFCTVCHAPVSEPHTWGGYEDDGEGKHYQTCVGCGRESTHRDHVERIDEATGNKVCKTCGAVITPAQTEAPVSTDSDAIDSDSGEDKGCKSMVSCAMVLVVMIAACGLIVKGGKKKGCAKL
ncbi:MAG: hypothetical protein IKC59_03080 [Clostridia bacterium]|nr:hypothetical protein [Clostridia bacterium]